MVKIVLVLLVLAALAAGAVVGVVWGEAWLRLGGEPVAALDEDVEALGTDAARAPDAATTVLVALVEEHDPAAARPAPLAGEVALVQVAPEREEVAVVLLPTHLEVTVDGEGDRPLAEVHRQGLDELVRGVVDYTGVAVDHAVVAGMGALGDLTAALGGVERCGEQGCRLLDEEGVRQAVARGEPVDRARAVAQVLRGLGARVGADTAVRSPLAAHRAIGVLSNQLTTDVSLRGTRVLDLAAGLARDRPVDVAVVPGVDHPDSGRFMVRPEQAEILFQHLRRGSGFTEEATASPEEVPEDVQVGVLNGTGTAGFAGRVADRLGELDVPVVGTDNAAHFDHEHTEVAYRADDPQAEIAAVLIAEGLGDVELEPQQTPPLFVRDEVDVLVTAGADLDDGEDA